MINRKIIDDYRLGQLPVEARLLFRDFIIMADREGRLQADPHWINKKFFAFDAYSDEQIEEWLKGLASQKKNGVPLIELFEVEGRKYLYLPGFELEQSASWRNVTKAREAPSDIPEPPSMSKKGKRGKKEPESAPPTVQQSDIIDPELKALVQHYENKIGQLSPTLFERLRDDLKEHGANQVKKAIDEAVKNKVHNLKYIEKILENWKQNGESRGHNQKAEPEGSLSQSIGKALT